MEEKIIIREKVEDLQVSLKVLDKSIEEKSRERKEMIGIVNSADQIPSHVARNFDLYVNKITVALAEDKRLREEYLQQLERLTLQLCV